MRTINLSYVITTKNKLNTLKGVLVPLLENKENDEEIIILDGLSEDGTVEYLLPLHREGKIDVFLSEKDLGEGHGFNKALLLAKGEIIKIITDDDIFNYTYIKECKKIMLENKNIDVFFSNGLSNASVNGNQFEKIHYDEDWLKWKDFRQPFSFCGLGLLIRRSSLAKTGLFSLQYIRVDMEFSLRVTSSKTNIAFYSGYGWTRVLNDKSNSYTSRQKMLSEGLELERIYQNKSVALNFLKIKMKSILYRIKLKFKIKYFKNKSDSGIMFSKENKGNYFL